MAPPMVQPMGMAQPMGMVQPMGMAQPMGMQGGVAVQQTTTVTVPGSYNRSAYNYNGMYSRMSPFIIPFGVDEFTAARFIEASQIFRTFDRNCSGTLSWHEWKEAMHAMGHYMSHYDSERLFNLVDRDRSGRIDEREFCEYWAFACHPTTGYYRHHHHHHRGLVGSVMGAVDASLGLGYHHHHHGHHHHGHHHHHHHKW